jgi:alpha-tubulin suppressor-like RCC1 family protein
MSNRGKYHNVNIYTIVVFGCGLTLFLGENDYKYYITPKQLDLCSGHTITHISAGTSLTLFLTSTGKCFVLKPKSTQIEYLSSLNSSWIAQVDTCHQHHILRTVDGRVFTWGNNEHGQLCHGDKSWCDAPKEVEFFKNKNPYFVCCGRWVCYICTKGTFSKKSHIMIENDTYKLYGCGNAKYLGIHKDWSACTIPVVVKSDIQFQKISTSNHTVALTVDGNVYSWGYNRNS